MEENNITYLLGAGASANAIPVVQNFKEKLDDFLNFFNTDLNKVPLETILRKNQVNLDLISKFTSITDEIKRHHTPDTLGKKLFLNNSLNSNFDLNDFKLYLSLYFIYLQFRQFETYPKFNIDFRYDVFWSTLLNLNTKKLPNNIKIISWNYDLQIELSYFNIFNSLGFDKVFQEINSYPFKNIENPSIIKLNGSAGLIEVNDDQTKFVDLIYLQMGNSIIKYLDEYFNSNVNQSLKFAWENDTFEVIQKAKKIIEETDILVIIGYSFPTFNREVDLAILGGKNFDKVYIQDMTKSSGELLIDKFNNINLFSTIPTDIVPIQSNEFYIPFEFNNTNSSKENYKLQWLKGNK